jgi:hypothetical protein
MNRQSHFFQSSCFFSRSHFLKAGAYVHEDPKSVLDAKPWAQLLISGICACFPDNGISSTRANPEAIMQAFPLRREIELIFTNYLRSDCNSSLRRLQSRSELVHHSLGMPEISGRRHARTALIRAWILNKKTYVCAI